MRNHASARIYRGGFGHISCQAGHLAQGAIQPEDLCQELIVENEGIGVFVRRVQTLE